MKSSKILKLVDSFFLEDDGVVMNQAKEVFKKVMFAAPSKAVRTLIEEHELIQPVKYADIFTSLTDNLDEICISQSQVIELCKKRSNTFRPNNYSYLSLVKINNDFFVANVRLYSVISKTLNLYVWPLFDDNADDKEGSNYVWECSEFPPHIFIPVKKLV